MPSPFENAKQFFMDNPQSIEDRTCDNCDGNCLCKASKGIDNNDIKESNETESNEIETNKIEVGYKESN